MPDMFNLTPQMKMYFDTLPKAVQKSIEHNPSHINSLEDLKAAAESVSENGKE